MSYEAAALGLDALSTFDSVFGGGESSAVKGSLKLAREQFNAQRRQFQQSITFQDRWNQANLRNARYQFRRLENRDDTKIRTLVNDAVRAGIHPLYALGGGHGSVSPTSFVPGQAPSGSVTGTGLVSGYDDGATLLSGAGELAGAIRNYRDRKEAKKEAAELKKRAEYSDLLNNNLTEAQIASEWAKAQMYYSESKRAEQDANARRSDPWEQFAQPSKTDVDALLKKIEGAVEPKAGEVTARRPGKPGTSAGDMHMWNPTRDDANREWFMPSDDASNIEGMVPTMMFLWKNFIAPALDVESTPVKGKGRHGRNKRNVK